MYHRPTETDHSELVCICDFWHFYSPIGRHAGFISTGIKPVLRWYYASTKDGDSTPSAD